MKKDSFLYDNCVLFGGGGYIGSFFAGFLVKHQITKTVYLADISQEKRNIWPQIVKNGLKSGSIKYLHCDVRNKINNVKLPDKCDLIGNFAAIHREPGHTAEQYFQTNLLGAENVCDWASNVNCDKLIFTSSIAPYGYSGHQMDEHSLAIPTTPYGASKLVAERIHICWQKEKSSSRYLSIVRPGVIFGPGEDGNVPRMVKAIRKNYFFYLGNRHTVKAGGYVKELSSAMNWVLKNQIEKSQPIALYNFSFPQPPTIEEYAKTIQLVLGKKNPIFSLPFRLILVASYIIYYSMKLFPVQHPFDPVRIKKLGFSNNIIPKFLIDNGYIYKYDLLHALENWKEEAPEDWK